ncbi:type 2 lanthipeptide synthetase LanM family protein [Caldicellulosiruptor acetigenus]|uniref:Lanthionine synthetase C family protein n=1 Tax=Caldicellulosiruptor acetigenus 6A TaxID=632516 RepID=G2PVM4_9FIRM|nr:type 2 lanthipeptide synthetase LanM family protein [Caldicellulosiruptor acetigenus]AEM74624.1 Lanthionine synthetase C family protein [Caldicellulosiruptor acetigenus 6A]
MKEIKKCLESSYIDEMLKKLIPEILFIDERIRLYKELGFCNYNIEQLEEWVNTRGLFYREHFYEYLDLKGLTVEDMALAFKKLTEEEKNKLLEKAKQLDCINLITELIINYLEEFESIDVDLLRKDFGVSLDLLMLPFIYYLSKKLRDIRENIINFQIDSRAIESIVRQLSEYLIQISIKAIICELHDYKEKGLLKGETGEERFQFFIEDRFKEPKKLIDFYLKYPVLLRRLAKKTKDFTEFIEKMLTDIDKSFVKICAKIDIKNDVSYQITNIECGKGDVHERCRFTAIIEIEGEKKLVYKPRCLKVKEKFEEFIGWINGNANAVVPDFLNLIVNKGVYEEDFTIEEFVTYDSCKTEEEVKRYYIRLGEIGALIYLLGGNDIHYENVIAHREYPVVVDLESLFQGDTAVFTGESDAYIIAFNKIIKSIARTGVLPFAFGGNNLDLSAVGGDKQKVPYKVLKLVEAGTDNMHLEYDEAELGPAQNIPLLNGEKVDYKDYGNDIIYGIKMIFDFVTKKKEEFLSKLEIFRGEKVRKIIRSTQYYARMMDFSTHPAYLSDAVKFERLYLNMWASPYKNKRIVLSEINDMLNDDIPIFYGLTDSKILIDSFGKQIEDCYDKSSIEEVKELIGNIDNNFIEEQVTHATVALGLFEKLVNKKFECIEKLNFEENDMILEKQQELLLNGIKFLYNEIVKEVIWDNNKKTCSWISPIYDNKNNLWKLSPLSVDFFRGVGGIYLFLNYYSELLLDKNEELKELLNALQYTLYKGIKDGVIEAGKRKNNEFIMNSINSIIQAIYVLLVSQPKNKDRTLFEVIELLLELLENKANLILDDKVMFEIDFNIIIKILIELYKYTGLDKCLKLVEIFLNQFYKSTCTIKRADNIYSGYGMLSVNLCELSHLINDVSLLEQAKELLDRNFKDYINTQDCSFYSGLGGFLMCLSQVYNKANEISNFLPVIKKHIVKIGNKINIDDSVFYGAAGEIEAIYSIYNLTKDDEIKSILNKRVQYMLSRYNKLGSFNIKSLEKFKTVYFSQGLSGIGYTLLRIYNLSKLPNVLIFDT